jgi:hypothetical protein
MEDFSLANSIRYPFVTYENQNIGMVPGQFSLNPLNRWCENRDLEPGARRSRCERVPAALNRGGASQQVLRVPKWRRTSRTGSFDTVSNHRRKHVEFGEKLHRLTALMHDHTACSMPKPVPKVTSVHQY